MKLERKRLLFDLTVWSVAPLLVFALLAVEMSRRRIRGQFACRLSFARCTIVG